MVVIVGVSYLKMISGSHANLSQIGIFDYVFDMLSRDFLDFRHLLAKTFYLVYKNLENSQISFNIEVLEIIYANKLILLKFVWQTCLGDSLLNLKYFPSQLNLQKASDILISSISKKKQLQTSQIRILKHDVDWLILSSVYSF